MTMEPWAKRIYSRMNDLGRTQADLAKACGVKGASVSGWFGKGSRPAKMLTGENVVMAARFLGVTAEWIITGRGAPEAVLPSQSQLVQLDPDKVAETHAALSRSFHEVGIKYDIESDAARFVRAYQLRDAMPANPSRDEWVQYGQKLQEIIAPQGAQPNGRNDGGAAHGAPAKGVARGAGHKA